MRSINHPTLAVLLALAPVALAPAATFAQPIKSSGAIENELLPPIGQPLGGTERGLGRIKPNTPTSSANTAPVNLTRPLPATTPSPTAAPEQPEGPVSDLVVQFANGSAELTPEGAAQLDQLAVALAGQKLSSFRFQLEGHTDTVGSVGYNQTLSDHRAEVVLDYLVQNGHIGRDRLQAIGFGKTHLLVSTADQTPEPRNRRVRVVNLGGSSGG